MATSGSSTAQVVHLGACGSAFAIVAAVADPAVPAKTGVTLFLATRSAGLLVVSRHSNHVQAGQRTFDQLTDCAVDDSQSGGLGTVSNDASGCWVRRG